MMTFCHPVMTAPAVIKGGAVMAGGWLPDFARLGELERHAGDGVIEALAEKAVADGRMPAPQRRRIMSLAFTMRLVVAMALMPEASYAGAIRRLAGLLAGMPWVQGVAHSDSQGGHRLARQGAAGGDGGAVLAGSRPAGAGRRRRRR
jgi:hypothetical protein